MLIEYQASKHRQIPWFRQVSRVTQYYLGVCGLAFLLNMATAAYRCLIRYCENGSLHSISKNFGKFPENLVGIYMSQVLHGLLYLHEQGVIHRDIKGANILTTKQGLVKLADFGVATRTTTFHESSVVGTPYWMAPEVIELSGATTASDIWSLGCTVIELLDGKPPYHKLQPMHALFRIVNDDHPPLPEGASPVGCQSLKAAMIRQANTSFLDSA